MYPTRGNAHTSFPADTPSALVRLQKKYWDPLVAWLHDTYGLTLGQTSGFGLPEHSVNANAELRAVLSEMDNWELAAFERAVYATKSFVIALAFVKGRITADEAAHTAQVEVRAQIEQWGEVEDSESRRRRRGVLTAAHDVDYQDIRRSLGTVAMLLARV